MQANHPGRILRHHGAGQHLTAGVPYPHQIAIDNPRACASCGSIVTGSRPATAALAQRGGSVDCADGGPDGPTAAAAARLCVAMPLVGLQPHRMRWTVGVTKSGDGRRVDLLPLAVFSGLAGIGAEGGETRKTGILRLLRHLNQLVSLPEFGKWRQRHLLLAAPGGHLIESLQPRKSLFLR